MSKHKIVNAKLPVDDEDSRSRLLTPSSNFETSIAGDQAEFMKKQQEQQQQQQDQNTKQRPARVDPKTIKASASKLQLIH